MRKIYFTGERDMTPETLKSKLNYVAVLLIGFLIIVAVVSIIKSHY